jgi:replication-associated recombination protein RarA
MGYQQLTKGGFNFFHVSSAFQKCVRRGMEHEALYFGTELYISGFEEYAWFRMLVMASEDVGLAETTVVPQLRSLYETYVHFKAKKNSHGPERLPFTHAILILVRCKKSRLVDNKLCYYFFKRDEIAPPDFPDFVFDMHTIEGKKKGRGNAHFYEESAKIENDNLSVVPDEYEFRDFIRDLYAEEDSKPNKEDSKPIKVNRPLQRSLLDNLEDD